MAKALLAGLAAGMFCLSGMAKDAAATVTFSLVWQATTGAGVTGSDTIHAATGDVLTLGIQMTTNQTIGGHSVSLNFDVDLGNELDLYNPNGGANWSGTTYGSTSMTTTYSQFKPVGVDLGVTESTSGISGRINSFHSFIEPWGSYLPTGTYMVGTARFVVGAVAIDGPDVFIGLFNQGVDDVLNNLNTVIPVSGLVFGSATVNHAPEPGTATLVGLGLVGILLGRRRTRRS